MDNRHKMTMDGNQAAAHVAFAFTEVAAIYPITPSSPMADFAEQWAAEGKKNIFGSKPKIIEMQSEGGAAGTVHGSLAAGALTTTFTASQGLLLMLPNMYKIAAERLPGVFHVSARAIATHALSIFGDQSDIYAARQTGFAMLAEGSPQEVMDLAPVAHLAAIEAKLPFLNFFDGFRTSHEIQKVAVWEYDALKKMLDQKALAEFRNHALNPAHPAMRGSHENGDIFFQHREACNAAYDAVPAVVRKYMELINAQLGTDYNLFNYYGAPDAERVIIAMGSVCAVAEEAVDYLASRGEKVGLVKVRLYRPWLPEGLLDVLPPGVKKIAVLDRTKEPGALAEPLFLDVAATLREAGREDIRLCGGRYGLGSKDTPASSILAVYKELENESPRRRFTIGIEDDVTHLSLPEARPAPETVPAGTVECKFWGTGGDGTVGANKDSIKIIGDHTEKFVQGYFQYDSKKTGGVTISHLRFGDAPIKSSYYVTRADFVACHSPSYITKGFKIAQEVKKDGIFLVNCTWSDEELAARLSPTERKYIAENNVQVYAINAVDGARRIGLGGHTSTILQAAFFKLSGILPEEEAVRLMKEKIAEKFASKGQDIVDMNCRAVEEGVRSVRKVALPDIAEQPQPAAEAAVLPEELPAGAAQSGRNAETAGLVETVMESVNRMEGDSLPVSAFAQYADGQFPVGASEYEKRAAAVMVPEWDAAKCVQCTTCSFVCSHATIRPFLLNDAEAAAAPKEIKLADAKNPKLKGFKYTISVSPMDCMGCGECITVCPTQAISLVPRESQEPMQGVFDYLKRNVSPKPETESLPPMMASQFRQPLLEFSGSCGGCAESSYARLVTQLFGTQMYISNATGCSSIWGGPAATCPYTRENKTGRGPAWANSLFEDNAEHGLGMYLGQKFRRDEVLEKAAALSEAVGVPQPLRDAVSAYLATKDDTAANAPAADALVRELEAFAGASGAAPSEPSASEGPAAALAAEILARRDDLPKKSVWIFGGDGWAYDIGFGGLDHVLASGENVNMLVFDTEMYSNTGGQTSKSSNIGAVGQFAAAGKEGGKKNLAEIAMSYGSVYVAQIALSANPGQTVKVLQEAEAYNGPSLIVAYAPCELHGIRGGMGHCQDVMKSAVKSGYWNLFSFNPQLKAEGKNPFTLYSKPGDGSYQAFLNNETRYTKLVNEAPERAKILFARNEAAATARYEHLLRLVELYK
ncbi:MAG: pyruvate:ferredoxin (flavodoxin) oxidoreductase [Treponemataceae bacterium]|nr:pyruvate:ferredoxin (flavodoxin) oxidoreductase [Treponemataceae bacterium]